MTALSELAAAARALADDTPYAVTDTEHGFDVTLDLADVRFHDLFARHRFSKAHVHRVAVDEEARTFTMLDVARTVEWSAGASSSDLVPRYSGSGETNQGRIWTRGRRKVYAWDEELRYGAVVDYDFSTAEGHSLVRTAAGRVGLTERQPWQVKVAMGVGIGTLVLIALSAVGLVIGFGVAWAVGAL